MMKKKEVIIKVYFQKLEMKNQDMNIMLLIQLVCYLL